MNRDYVSSGLLLAISQPGSRGLEGRVTNVPATSPLRNLPKKKHRNWLLYHVSALQATPDSPILVGRLKRVYAERSTSSPEKADILIRFPTLSTFHLAFYYQPVEEQRTLGGRGPDSAAARKWYGVIAGKNSTKARSDNTSITYTPHKSFLTREAFIAYIRRQEREGAEARYRFELPEGVTFTINAPRELLRPSISWRRPILSFFRPIFPFLRSARAADLRRHESEPLVIAAYHC